jgi:hypothetical protein
MRVVQALYWLKDLLPSERDGSRLRLNRILSDPDSGSAIRDDLKDGLPAMPTWMQSIVRELLQDIVGANPAHVAPHNPKPDIL